MSKERTSKFRGVCFDKKKHRWRMTAGSRNTRVQVYCESELEAAMLYNAVARKFWPGCRVNTPEWKSLEPDDDGRDYICHPFGKAFWLGRHIDGEDKVAIVDQSAATKWHYYNLKHTEWFYRDGFVQRAEWDQESRTFTFYRMNDLVFGGPSEHINGQHLDNRRVNLRAAEVVEFVPARPGVPAKPASVDVEPAEGRVKAGEPNIGPGSSSVLDGQALLDACFEQEPDAP